MTKKTHLQCGARTRAGGSCKCRKVVGNARCRFHGGLSTCPRTPEGKARSTANLLKANQVRAAMPPEWHSANARKAAATRARNARINHHRELLLRMQALGIRVNNRPISFSLPGHRVHSQNRWFSDANPVRRHAWSPEQQCVLHRRPGCLAE